MWGDIDVNSPASITTHMQGVCYAYQTYRPCTAEEKSAHGNHFKISNTYKYTLCNTICVYFYKIVFIMLLYIKKKLLQIQNGSSAVQC